MFNDRYLSKNINSDSNEVLFSAVSEAMWVFRM